MDLRNRIVVAPMCQYSAVDGSASDWHLIHLGQLALSGAALLILEATAVEPQGRITLGDLGLYSDANEAALRRVLHAIRKHSTMKIGIQISHAGRRASCHAPWEGGHSLTAAEGAWQTVAPSPLPYAESDRLPRELRTADLECIKDAFVAAASRAVSLGLDSIELHFAHGYLIHQFLSPISNQRHDQYGGNFTNRIRFPLEVFDAVRKATPSRVALGVRLSATDWIDSEPSWNIDQSVRLTKSLAQSGASYVHVTTGGISPRQKIVLGEGYQVPFAERIRAESKLTTIAVGLVTDPRHAEEIVAQGRADFVAVARAVLFEPHWPWRAAAELGARVEVPPQYWRSQPRGLDGLFGDIDVRTPLERGAASVER